MAALFNPPTLPAIPPAPPVPTTDTKAVQAAGEQAVKKQQQQQGRASTYLTDPMTQRTPDLSKQRYLGAA